jgi:putative PIN family toxin of toxin-antitoxin system
VRVLLDVNILISYLLTTRATSPVHRVIRAAIASKYVLLMPEELLAELRRTVFSRPYLAERIPPTDVDLLTNLLSVVAEIVPAISAPIPRVTRDPKDDYLLAYAIVGRADYLVTGDDDLLSLTTVAAVTIIRLADFARLIEGQA